MLSNSIKKELVESIYNFMKKNSINPEDAAQVVEAAKNEVVLRLCSDAKGYFVRKKNGAVQKFDVDKLIVSVSNASDEIHESLTAGDIHNIINDIMDRLKNLNLNVLGSDTIREVTLTSLKELGFMDMYNRYKNFIKEVE